MTNLLPIPAPATDVVTQDFCIAALNQANGMLYSLQQQQKNEWVKWWDPNLTAAQVQAQIDYIASIPGTDVSGATNVFAILCNKSTRLINYILGEDSAAYSDAALEKTGVLQPTGFPYQRFISPGWYYQLDNTKPSGIAVSSPCIWNE